MPSSSWSDVVRALDSNDARKALRLALEVWSAHRTGKASDVVVALGERVASAGEQLPKRGQAAFEAMWSAMVASGDPAVLSTVLVGWSRMQGPVDETGDSPYVLRRFATHLARRDVIATWPSADPRIARMAESLLAEPPWSAFSYTSLRDVLFDPLFALVQRHGDERSIAFLEALPDSASVRTKGSREYFAEIGKKAIAALKKTLAKGKAPSEKEQKALGSLFKTLELEPEKVRDDRDLLAEVFAKPDDDELRVVCADWLLEKGDPRGELIVLQRKREASAPPAPRETAIVRKHGKELVGALVAVSKEWRFEGGFLVEADLVHNASASPAGWAAAAIAPELATVRRLAKSRANEAHYASFVLSPSARSLVDVDVPSRAFLETLAAHETAKRIERLRLLPVFGKGLAKALEAAVAKGAFPHLAIVEVVAGHDAPEDAFKLVAGCKALRAKLTELRFVGQWGLDSGAFMAFPERAAELGPIPVVSVSRYGTISSNAPKRHAKQ